MGSFASQLIPNPTATSGLVQSGGLKISGKNAFADRAEGNTPGSFTGTLCGSSGTAKYPGQLILPS